MPNGVICGGAVDGSNQLGAIVTCHAMTARPDGVGAAAVARVAPSATAATRSRWVNARRTRRTRNDVMSTLRAGNGRATGAVPREWVETGPASTRLCRACGHALAQAMPQTP